MSKKTVLVVDDEADMRIFVSTVAETNGFQSMAAENGVEALALARTAATDLVVLDVMMPNIEDGLKTYREFKTDSALIHIPIIMLSAIARRTFFHSLKLLPGFQGAATPEPEAYIEKPPEADILIRQILALIGSTA